MKICFWATTFQSDIQTLAYHLADRPDFDVVVAMDRPEVYKRDVVSRIRPFPARLVDRRARGTKQLLKQLGADVLVVDNHLPGFRIADKILVIWHGFGWRMDDISGMRKQLKKHVGDVTRPNPNFIWQAFGEWDGRYTVKHRKIAAENVVPFGSAYSDVLSPGSALVERFDPKEVADGYRVDVVSKKTVLVGMTWHHGGLLGQFGDETALLDQMLDHLRKRDVSVIFRMHDRPRYEKAYLDTIESMIARHSHAQLKFKDQSPDSLVDILVGDVLVTNFSSFANAFYYTHKPSVHIHPTATSDRQLYMRHYKRGRVRLEKLSSEEALWKLPAEENGGLVATSFEALLAHLDRALDDPGCCEEAAGRFIEKYITKRDGRTCDRIRSALLDW
jgi:hypothetical protein